ncbi:hypothetical protein G436_2647 [Leptospira interrogans serovar Hardjo str. Norma]|uniref:Uncharacterized protein n=1 Tax=Leptospira interrogans serovar Hardjo str. Norma TaxID=1279460 RepID=A0A0M4MUR5_LEPIR|nr:hypothetical protein G436_2647 [Leptospira interrogans serovar Hardjo str. Norma]
MFIFLKKIMTLVSKMWELPQITILRTNAGTHTFRKFFLTPNSH